MLANSTVGILDMHDGYPNQGMRCIKEIVSEFNDYNQRLDFTVYDVRGKSEVPDIGDHDIYISSGGPGSPFEGHGKDWESRYFNFLEKIWAYNQNYNGRKKYIFFICYSYQLMCRFFKLAQVGKRRSTSFGVFPVYKTEAGKRDPLLAHLPNPYYAVDSRDWQLVQPYYDSIAELGASIISLEKIRANVDYERAMMAMRLSDTFVGTQYHPEAEPITMGQYFQQPEKAKQIIDNYGEVKLNDMISQLSDPQRIALTHNSILPSFLKDAVTKLRIEEDVLI